MSILFDPKIFNYIIMGLYALNVGRWALHGGWVDAFYWTCALGLTMTVTWGYAR